MWQCAKYATRLRFWNVTSAGWQVTLCDPMWHVSSRSGVATLRTAIHLLLTYFWLTAGTESAGVWRAVSALIGVNATGDTSPAMFGQPGTKYLISPAKFVKFLLSHAKRHCVEPMNTARCFD